MTMCLRRSQPGGAVVAQASAASVTVTSASVRAASRSRRSSHVTPAAPPRHIASMFHELQEPPAVSPNLSGRLARRRHRSVRGALPAVCALVGALLAPAVASAATGAVTFTDPGEHAFRVPQGLVGALHIDAVGAAGQDATSHGFQARGGIGAVVAGNFAVASGGLYAGGGVGGGGGGGRFWYPGWRAPGGRRGPVGSSFFPGRG